MSLASYDDTLPSYLLPVSIENSRIHICEFRAQASGVIYEFVVPYTTARKTLFTIPVKNDILQCVQGGTDSDINISSHHYLVTEEDDSMLVIFNPDISEIEAYNKTKKLHQGRNGKVLDGKVLYRVVGDGDERKIEFNSTNAFPVNSSIKVKLRYTHVQDPEDVESYEYEFIIHFCSRKLLKRVALDFGSDSSQVAYKSGEEGSATRPFPIVSELQRFYDPLWQRETDSHYQAGQHSENALSDYLQYAREGEFQLLKSLFFIEKELAPISRIRTTAPSSTDPIKMLVRASEAKTIQDNLIIPNLKLSELTSRYGNEELIIVGNNGRNKRTSFNDESTETEIRHTLINKILHAVFDRMAPIEEQPNYFQLVFLVPNIYSQERISKLIHGVYHDIQLIRSEYPDYQIAGIEISTISESDAAFCGYVDEIYKNQDFLKANQSYLIIDAGGGTIDFSVIRSTDKRREFKGIYRAGIAGSGQLISYSIGEAAAKQTNISQLSLVQRMFKSSYSQQLRFLEILEELKKKKAIRYHKEKKLNGQNYHQYAFSLDNFAEQVESLDYIDDEYNIVGSAIDELVQAFEKLITYLPDKKFSRIILTGRAFLMDEFRERFTELLKDYLPGQEIPRIEFNPANAKIICLFGALSNTCVVNDNANITGNLLIVDKRDQPEPVQKKPKKGFMGKLGNTFEKMLAAPAAALPRQNTTFDINERLFAGEYTYRFDPDTAISYYVGGVNYEIQERLDKDTLVKISIGREGYYFRTRDKAYLLNPEKDKGGTGSDSNSVKRILKTVFPFAGTGELESYLEKNRITTFPEDPVQVEEKLPVPDVLPEPVPGPESSEKKSTEKDNAENGLIPKVQNSDLIYLIEEDFLSELYDEKKDKKDNSGSPGSDDIDPFAEF